MPEQRGIDDQSWRPDSRFLEEVANEVHILFFPPAPPANMQRFKDQVRAAIAFQKRHDEPRAKLERREQEHSEKVKRNARLRDQKAGPPKDGWEWDKDFLVEFAPGIEEGAWVPPGFPTESDLPPRSIPSGVCPPDIPWEIGLPGRYVILGIVHDNSDHATRHYRPELLKDFDLPLAFSVPRDCGAGSDTGEMGFADFDRDSIKRALKDVKTDLESHLANYEARAATMNRRKPKTAAPRTLEQWAACRKTVLAVVFTDIVRSTAMRERLGDEKMDRLLKAHFDIATRVVRRCCGCLVQTGADETLAVFRTASAALCFALKLQSQPGGPNLRIRAGIHVGRISIKGNKPSGQTLNYAKRVMDEAANGGICLSNQAKADIVQEGQHRLSKVKYRAKGNVKLKGIKGMCTVWLVRTKARA
jgi:class 3 adenylate cyclase